ncbi:hypothetical protein ABVK25_007499 [Lepraria finkii]|uniref:SAM domain-containing protein n=1 Tax=Lepraria finkii TaxID=1340010 RepID=A0ABR4B367_9LECA
MAVLAPKAPYSSSMGMGPNQPSVMSEYAINYRDHKPSAGISSHNGPFMSPTESEFSESGDGQDSIRSWDEKRVGEWLRAINCPQYEQLFKVNNVTGNNLIECDQIVLKEMGIKKIGDRVRIFVAIKQLRTKAVGNHRKRNRDSLAALDNRQVHTPYTPSSSSTRSPRDLNSTRSHPDRKRWSQQVDLSALNEFHAANGNQRPNSPLAESEGVKRIQGQRYGGNSPLSTSRKDPSQGYFNPPPSAKGLRPATPRGQNQSMDSTVGKLPVGSAVIRVIYSGGQTKVLDIKSCKTLEDIFTCVLRKLSLPENQARNYCFWNLDGSGQDLNNTHRLSDNEMLRLCTEPYDKNERGRLILRKRHAGEPDEEELRKASSIAMEEQNEMHVNALAVNNTVSRAKVQKLTGESWNDVSVSLVYSDLPSTTTPEESERQRSFARMG